MCLQFIQRVSVRTLLVLVGDGIEPGCHAVSRAGNLFLDDGAGCFKVLATELLASDGLWTFREN